MPAAVPFDPVIPAASALLCIYLMLNLATLTLVFFAGWLGVGLVVYFGTGLWNVRLDNQSQAEGRMETFPSKLG